jgi:hypothetical protein
MARPSEGVRRESLAQSTKKAIMNQSTNFGARGVIFAQASWIATLSGQSKEEARPGDNKIRISGAWRAAVTGLAHGSPHVEGVALPKFVERGNFSLNKLVIRWISVTIDHQTVAG